MSTTPLTAYWIGLAGDRDTYRDLLEPELLGRGIAVLIIRDGGFDNPNALMVDLSRLLDQNRDRILPVLEKQSGDGNSRLGLVLLARTELSMGQAYSAAIWPDWVPAVGNKQTTCYITDLTRRIDVSLDAEEIDVSKLRHGIFTVEEALVRRLQQVRDAAPQRQEALFGEIRRRSDVSWLTFLNRAAAEAKSVPNSESYRPQIRSGNSVVSRLWEATQLRTPREQEVLEAALHSALDLDGVHAEDPWDSLATVLTRRSAPQAGRSFQFVRNLIVSVATASQYITCSAHAGDYQRYPLSLLVSFTDDLHQSLLGIESNLIHLTAMPPIAASSRPTRKAAQ